VAYRRDVLGYKLVVSAVDRGMHFQGVAHIFARDGSHLRTIETSARHSTLSAAESLAEQMGGEYVRSLPTHVHEVAPG
jgi:hypothetical protein